MPIYTLEALVTVDANDEAEARAIVRSAVQRITRVSAVSIPRVMTLDARERGALHARADADEGGE